MIVAKEGERLEGDSLEEVLLAVGFGPGGALSSTIYAASPEYRKVGTANVIAKLIAHVLYSTITQFPEAAGKEPMDAWWDEVRRLAMLEVNMSLAGHEAFRHRELGP